MCERKCGGQCCKRFYLPHAPDVFRSDYLRWLTNQNNTVLIKNDHCDNIEAFKYALRFNDIHIIYPMLIYLGSFDFDPADGRKLNEKVHHYTCAHHDGKTGLCRIYDTRPAMCRDYPYGVACRYPGCKDNGITAKNEKKIKEPELVKLEIHEKKKTKHIKAEKKRK
jgi:Fe-S-cluster containining protein